MLDHIISSNQLDFDRMATAVRAGQAASAAIPTARLEHRGGTEEPVTQAAVPGS